MVGVIARKTLRDYSRKPSYFMAVPAGFLSPIVGRPPLDGYLPVLAPAKTVLPSRRRFYLNLAGLRLCLANRDFARLFRGKRNFGLLPQLSRRELTPVFINLWRRLFRRIDVRPKAPRLATRRQWLPGSSRPGIAFQERGKRGPASSPTVLDEKTSREAKTRSLGHFVCNLSLDG